MSHPAHELCAVYVTKKPGPAEQTEWARRGIRLLRPGWIPPVPGHHEHGYHLARVPYSEIAALAAESNVVRIGSVETAKQPHLDIGRALTGVDDVHGGLGAGPFDGTGVTVCVADSGLDVNHPDIPTPAEAFDVTDGDDVSQWSTNVANTASFHGTHVTGIAVGTGAASGGTFRGVAPAATLNFYKIGDDVTSNAQTSDMIQAMARSQEVGCDVFSMSYGGLDIALDGSDAAAQAVDALVQSGTTALISAGNEGNDDRHAQASIGVGGSASRAMTLVNTGGGALTAPVFVVINWVEPTSVGQVSEVVTGLGAGESVTFAGAGNSPRATRIRLIRLNPNVPPGASRTYQLTIQVAAVAPAQIVAHAFSFSRALTFDQASDATTIASPSVADLGLSIGNFAHRVSWTNFQGLGFQFNNTAAGQRHPSSSQGPRLDGVQKPEFLAPGATMASALDEAFPPIDPFRIDNDGIFGQGPAQYQLSLGTSMACPFAAGTVALMVQARPDLGPADYRAALLGTAEGAAAPTAEDGNGLIDSLAAVQTVLADAACAADAECDDGNACTTDTCAPGGCVSAPAAGACDDGDPCTAVDTCTGGQCVGIGSIDCDDDNVCTDDACVSGIGCQSTPSVGVGGVAVPCDDGDPCTATDECAAGACVGQGALSCDDGNSCTDDTCEPGVGCQSTPTDPAAAVACDDGDPCTLTDGCFAGACLGIGVLPCVDSNPCATASCVAGIGCQSSPSSGAACSDGDACTTADACVDGNCVGGPAPDCDDGNPCTADSCDPGSGCVSSPTAAACDDGDDCTTDDTCLVGQCVGGPPLECPDASVCTDSVCVTGQGCQAIPTTGPCDDGDACTVGDFCGTGTCQHGDPLVCDDGNPCTADTCDVLQGCVATPAAGECSDGDACTTGDACSGGVCVGGPPLTCADGNECTLDLCDPIGGCSFPATPGACDDGDPCTESDGCTGSVCVGGGAIVCDDGNPCTVDTCTAGVGCVFAPVEVAACDDGNPCTSDDACVDGECAGTGGPECDDGDPCTQDTCQPDTGCVFPPADGPCDDGDVCTTGDACVEGTCIGGPELDCDDGELCTADGCVPGQGCTNTPAEGPCDDLSDCTLLDACQGGECVGGDAPDCDDGNPCTLDGCDPAVGCVSAPAAAPTCDDGDACTTEDRCVGGACVGGDALTCDDGESCTEDSCDPTEGCAFDPVDGPCSDGNACTNNDACDNGECAAGPPTNCNDGNQCTADGCVPDLGCINSPLAGPCDDDDLCTTEESCIAGACVPGGALFCDDGDLCTFDLCQPTSGCEFVNNPGGNCDDGDPCTLADFCEDTGCEGTEILECGDGNPCTSDACAPGIGCVNLPVAAGAPVPCDDGDPCTADDVCAAGVCGGAATPCDDGNVCTIDTCEAGVGCTYSDASGECDDGDACTVTDACAAGECVGSGALPCDDGNVCTSNGCDAELGCVATPAAGPCDDGDACTVGDSCANGVCEAWLLDCSDSNPCTEDSCDAVTGCQNPPVDGGGCDDGDPCTTGDVCAVGACAGSGELECDDGNPCTKDWCVFALGCVFTNVDDVCDDGNGCTTGDACVDGACVGTGGQDCDDDNPCTTDGCQPAVGCTNVPADGLCDDGDVCTIGDVCSGGACVGGQDACDDGNPCTDDSCAPGSGCVFAANGIACDDGDPCTKGDGCAGGVCVSGAGDATKCDDGDPCTTDTCTASGCAHAPIDAACDDGDVCTTDDACSDDGCTGEALSCDDGNDCTVDGCDPEAGCVWLAVDYLPCDDDDPCTIGGICAEGVCFSGSVDDCDDGNTCTTDECQPNVGCTYEPWDGGWCNDGNECTVADKCDQDVCQGLLKDCDDNKPCTVDTCVPGAGCQHIDPGPLACDDGNPCTVHEKCSNGHCKGGKPKLCDDDDACTADTCSGGDCVFTPTNDACDDGDVCTVDDQCSQGICTGAQTDCDDGNQCTVDTCIGKKGCKSYDLSNVSCEDGDPCTIGEVCAEGTCVGGIQFPCDDENPCTQDACDPVLGCVFTALAGCCVTGLDCQDGDLCNGVELCAEGGCVPGSSPECVDDEDCTDDDCDPELGCTFLPSAAGAPCDDGELCTEDDACLDGECKGGVVIEDCCVTDEDCDDDPQLEGYCVDNVCDYFDPISTGREEGGGVDGAIETPDDGDDDLGTDDTGTGDVGGGPGTGDTGDGTDADATGTDDATGAADATGDGDVVPPGDDDDGGCQPSGGSPAAPWAPLLLFLVLWSRAVGRGPWAVGRDRDRDRSVAGER